jgi:H+-transporting ATPase
MKSFLTYRIAASLQLLAFFFIALFAFHPHNYAHADHPPGMEDWPGFFSLPVLFLLIIMIINDSTLMSIGYDRAVPSKYPEHIVLPLIFVVAISLGVIACLSSLLLLYFALNSWSKGGLFQHMGIGGLTYGQIVNVIFLKVAITDILTLFSSRTSHQFFFQLKPHPILFICATFSLFLSTLLSLVWPCGTIDHIPVCGLSYHESHQKIALWVWLYCIVVFVIQVIIPLLLPPALLFSSPFSSFLLNFHLFLVLIDTLNSSLFLHFFFFFVFF